MARNDPPDLARAVGDWLRRKHPVHTLKNVAADLECSQKSAENLLNGHLSAAHTNLLMRAYGPKVFVEASLAATGQTLEDYVEQIRREGAHDPR